MSKVAIKGADTGTGVFTLESPATNTDRTLVLPDEAGTVLTTAGVPASAMPAGSVLQVVQTVDTTRVYYNPAAENTDLITATITPISTSSKILIILNAKIGGTNGNGGLGLRRNTTWIGGSGNVVTGGDSLHGANSFVAADDALNGIYYSSETYGMSNLFHMYLDSPSTTSAITYKVSVDSSSGVFIRGWNRAEAATNAGSGTSTFTLMEIAG